MKNIILRLYNLALSNVDKLLHFSISYAIVLTLILKVSPLVGILTGVLLGIAKEIFDKVRGGKFDFLDLFADALGIILAIFLGAK